jgi:O-acetyl-ADP-ribose deacetylase (regulator of RNase III)
MNTTFGATEIALEQGDITRHRADAIVNAANSSLMGGGGVDGAIHRAGGPAILEQCKQIRDERGRLPAGQAAITTGGNLHARHVIHTVGPIWGGGTKDEPRTLASCYRQCLDLAAANDLRTIAFPSISTGAYGYPVADAARVAVEAVRDWIASHPGAVDRVSWVLFDSTTFDAYCQALEE